LVHGAKKDEKVHHRAVLHCDISKNKVTLFVERSWFTVKFSLFVD